MSGYQTSEYTAADVLRDMLAQSSDHSSQPEHIETYAGMLNALRDEIHGRNVAAGWWSNLNTGERIERNMGELLALVHSEVSEALEGYRKNLMDDKLPHRPMTEVELADVIIRLMDIAGGFGYDIGGALVEKLEVNAKRADHKPENRKLANGKKF